MRALSGLLAAVSLAGLGLGVIACGNEGTGGGGLRQATLVLDFVPGPAHAGIYRALEQGLYAREGIELEIVEPTSTADTLKLIDAGQAEFGIADGSDVAGQISAGRGAKGILALTQRPLGGLITLAQSEFESPAQLEGATVGVTGVPSDDAVVETVIADAGGDPGTVEKVTIGFNGVQALENGKVDAFTGFIPADGVQAEIDGFPVTSFALDEYGGPAYPGLVVFSTEETIAEEPDLMQGFVAATIAGYEDVLDKPQAGLDALLAENPAIPADFAEASLDSYLPFFADGAAEFGGFDAAKVEDLSDFMVESGLAEQPISPDRYATNEFVDGAN
jgi:ABC-type nitrate/sulfonate/bicarbonate transport system substrate-binding protein